jgi:hypothetical protein
MSGRGLFDSRDRCPDHDWRFAAGIGLWWSGIGREGSTTVPPPPLTA